MAKPKLKDFKGTGEFEIIDEWTHRLIGYLPWEQAFATYGDCEVHSSYTCKSCPHPSANGNNPSWNTAVWIWIPGMHMAYSNNDAFTIPGEVVMDGDLKTITFTGKKSGMLITVVEYGPDDYSAWFRDESEKDNEFAGCSVRGPAKAIIKELDGEVW